MVGVVNRPTVSVVMPVRDAEPYLGASIGSILRQTHADLELIIVDDASRDSCLDIARVWAARDRRIHVEALPSHLGHAGALDAGLAVATGDFIALQDADDVSVPDRMARQLACLRAHPCTSLVGSDAFVTDAQGRVISRTRFPITPVAVRWRLLFANAAINLMWRRQQVADAVGGYDPAFTYAADYDFVARVSSQYDVRNVPAQLLYYRRHATAIGQRSREAETEFAEAISRRELSRLDGGLGSAAAVRLRCLSIGAASSVQPRALPTSVAELGSAYAEFCERWQRRKWTAADRNLVRGMLLDAECAAILAAMRASPSLAWATFMAAVRVDRDSSLRLPFAVAARLAAKVRQRVVS